MFANFDLWISKGGMDTFALVTNYMKDFWTTMQATIGLFKIHENTMFSMVRHLCTLFEKYDLMCYVIGFVKDEGNNLMFIVTSLCSIIDHHLLNFNGFMKV